MEDNRLPKQVRHYELPNADRPTVRTKLRFRDVQKRDLNALTYQILRGKNWLATKESGSQSLELERKHRKNHSSKMSAAVLIVAHDMIGHDEDDA